MLSTLEQRLKETRVLKHALIVLVLLAIALAFIVGFTCGAWYYNAHS